MSMFDEIVKTEFKADGSVEVELVESSAEELEAAAFAFVQAQRKFQQIAAHPLVYTDSAINCRWWDQLEVVYECEKRLWKLFTGEHPTVEQNKLFNQFREMLLKDKKMRANA